MPIAVRSENLLQRLASSVISSNNWHQRAFLSVVSRWCATPCRHAFSTSSSRQAEKQKGNPQQQKNKAKSEYPARDIRIATQYSLCDAIRYIRAFEVGRSPTSPKYELAVRLRTQRNAAPIRSRIRLPHPVRTDIRIVVICDPESAEAQQARAAGAIRVAQEPILEDIKAGKIDFDRCICHKKSLPALTKANVGRMLGPKGLMPSVKNGTVVDDVAGAIRQISGTSEYREKVGVVRLPIAQLGFSPEEVKTNIQTFIVSLKKEIGSLSDKSPKEICEIVLSSTHAPGFSLNGEFRSSDGISTADLST